MDLWENATQAVRIFSALRARYPDFFLGTMSIILRENYRFLAELIEFHYRLGSQQIGISYLEGNFSGRYLLNEDEILEFRQDVLPVVAAYCRTLDPRIRSRAMNMVEGLYGAASGNIKDFSRGEYWRKNYCDVPRTAALIMANGDIHPCNIVEYTHKPVMGNLFQHSFSDIWYSGNWDKYRKELHEKCRFCPVNIYSPVPLAYAAGSNLPVSVYHSKLFRPLRPAAGYLRDLYLEYRHKFHQ